MTERENQIIEYIRTLTRGIVNLKQQHAQQIIRIVEGDINQETVRVVKSRYNGANDNYEQDFIKHIPKSDAEAFIKKSKNINQFRGFYRYNITELNFEIYSVNPNLF